MPPFDTVVTAWYTEPEKDLEFFIAGADMKEDYLSEITNTERFLIRKLRKSGYVFMYKFFEQDGVRLVPEAGMLPEPDRKRAFHEVEVYENLDEGGTIELWRQIMTINRQEMLVDIRTIPEVF